MATTFVSCLYLLSREKSPKEPRIRRAPWAATAALLRGHWIVPVVVTATGLRPAATAAPTLVSAPVLASML
jgi:hypothetical protein